MCVLKTTVLQGMACISNGVHRSKNSSALCGFINDLMCLGNPA